MVQGAETDTTNAHFYMMIRPEDVVIDTVAPIYPGDDCDLGVSGLRFLCGGENRPRANA